MPAKLLRNPSRGGNASRWQKPNPHPEIPSGAGTVEIGGNTLLVWRYGNRVGPYMNGLHFAFGIGAILSPILIGRAMEVTGGLAGGFLLASLFILPGTVLLLRSSSPGAREESQDDGPRSSVTITALIALFLLLYVGAEAGA